MIIELHFQPNIDIESMFDKLSLKISEVTFLRNQTTFKGLCPFHKEKTPSFFVSQTKSSYFCFGCHAKGHIKELYKKFYDNYVEKKLIKTTAHDSQQEEIYFKVLDKIFYISQQNLLAPKNKAFMDFINCRGLTMNEALEFKLGAALNIVEQLLGFGYKETTLESLPYFKKINNKLIFELEGNLIFPIIDLKKRLVGFSGRNINHKSYISMRNNDYFKRGDFLFMVMYENNKPLYIVEGFFDVLSLAKRGITSAAIMGSNPTEKQIELLIELKNELVFAFDYDSAGIKANLKNYKLFGKKESLFALNKKFKDLDECIQKNEEIEMLSRKEYIELLASENKIEDKFFDDLYSDEKMSIIKKILKIDIVKAINIIQNLEDESFFFFLKKKIELELNLKTKYELNELVSITGISFELTNEEKEIDFHNYYETLLNLLILEEKLPEKINEYFSAKYKLELLKKKLLIHEYN